MSLFASHTGYSFGIVYTMCLGLDLFRVVWALVWAWFGLGLGFLWLGLLSVSRNRSYIRSLNRRRAKVLVGTTWSELDEPRQLRSGEQKCWLGRHEERLSAGTRAGSACHLVGLLLP